MNGSTEIRGARLAHRTALMVLLLATGACGLLDPVVTDLEVSGSVTDDAGTPIAGARVQLLRTTCTEATSCTSRQRGDDLTGSDGGFRIVVEREQDEVDLWDLVCHQFFIDVEADGYVPIEGNYQAWRGRFCASSDVDEVEFRLQPTA